MKIKSLIVPLAFLVFAIQPLRLFGSDNTRVISFGFCGDSFQFSFNDSLLVDFTDNISEASIEAFYKKTTEKNYAPVISALAAYKEKYNPDDWMYYQLIRKTAQQISPKEKNYPRYTLYKWFLLSRSGYDATIRIAENKILFYVRSDEYIYNIPLYIKGGKQYVCLNYHDYGNNIDFRKTLFTEATPDVPSAQKAFSYKITRMPGFSPESYSTKELAFEYNEMPYRFRIKLNPEVRAIFANYPSLDYNYYFNIPLSQETYSSLIPALKKEIRRRNEKNGVDFLMHFTRSAFLYKKDREVFGKEKRMSPEETLLYDESDCEDRTALFFYLVKEIYNLPMIVLSYPDHVTIAVKFSKPFGNTIDYNGGKYSICEPTPQAEDLQIGALPASLKNEAYKIVYEYNPATTTPVK